jgi:hypothetical protein
LGTRCCKHPTCLYSGRLADQQSVSVRNASSAVKRLDRALGKANIRKTPKLNDTEPLPYTLGQAAKATGKQKSTLLDAIRAGKISATKDEHGHYQIDPAELHRIYPPTVRTEQDEPPPNPYQMELLEQKIRFLEREVSRLEQTTEDLREDRDHWRRQATALIAHQPEPSSAEPPAVPGRLFEKLFGRWKDKG